MLRPSVWSHGSRLVHPSYRSPQTYERVHDLWAGSAVAHPGTRRGLRGGGMPEVVRTCRSLLGVVEHKADRLDEARAHLAAALTLVLDAGARTDEAYCRQELGFLLLDTGDSELALGEFHALLALAPGAVVVNLAGNGLNGMGVALLQLGRAVQAVPFLLATLAIRAEMRTLSNNMSTSCTSRPRRWRSAI